MGEAPHRNSVKLSGVTIVGEGQGHEDQESREEHRGRDGHIRRLVGLAQQFLSHQEERCGAAQGQPSGNRSPPIGTSCPADAMGRRLDSSGDAAIGSQTRECQSRTPCRTPSRHEMRGCLAAIEVGRRSTRQWPWARHTTWTSPQYSAGLPRKGRLRVPQYASAQLIRVPTQRGAHRRSVMSLVDTTRAIFVSVPRRRIPNARTQASLEQLTYPRQIA